MDEFTLGTSTITCMEGWPVRMTVQRTYGRMIWYRGMPIVFLPEWS